MKMEREYGNWANHNHVDAERYEFNVTLGLVGHPHRICVYRSEIGGEYKLMATIFGFGGAVFRLGSFVELEEALVEAELILSRTFDGLGRATRSQIESILHVERGTCGVSGGLVSDD
jgi:hypothetical protein